MTQLGAAVLLLRLNEERGEPITARELAEEAGIPRDRAGMLLLRLSRSGHVAACACHDQGVRARGYTLTDTAWLEHRLATEDAIS